MRTPALVFTNSLLFSQMYLHHIHAFPEHCDSCPAPGLCEQHQELPSSPGARLQTAATPGCVAVSAAQAETSQILWLKVWTALKCTRCVYFLILRSSLDSQMPFAQVAGSLNQRGLVFSTDIWFCPHLQAGDISVCLFLCRCGWEAVSSSLRNGIGSQRPWPSPGWTELWYQSSWQIKQV